MDVKKIIESGLINRSALAQKMFPAIKPKMAGAYLYKKLHGKERQHFNDNDVEKCKKIFTDLFGSN